MANHANRTCFFSHQPASVNSEDGSSRRALSNEGGLSLLSKNTACELYRPWESDQSEDAQQAAAHNNNSEDEPHKTGVMSLEWNTYQSIEVASTNLEYRWPRWRRVNEANLSRFQKSRTSARYFSTNMQRRLWVSQGGPRQSEAPPQLEPGRFSAYTRSQSFSGEGA